jgi:hypothetical protein
MGKYKSEEKADGTLLLKKSLEKLADENNELSKELDYITKEEIITAIKKIADKVGVEVNFTYDNRKNKLQK